MSAGWRGNQSLQETRNAELLEEWKMFSVAPSSYALRFVLFVGFDTLDAFILCGFSISL